MIYMPDNELSGQIGQSVWGEGLQWTGTNPNVNS